jgi:hypothetical protein
VRTAFNGTVTVRRQRAARLHETPVGLRPWWCFVPPHLGQGSMLRIALLPAPNVSYRLARYATVFLDDRYAYYRASGNNWFFVFGGVQNIYIRVKMKTGIFCFRRCSGTYISELRQRHKFIVLEVFKNINVRVKEGA